MSQGTKGVDCTEAAPGQASIIDNCIFNFIYEMAFRDATMRTTYTGDRGALKNSAEMRNIVRTYIESILDGKATNLKEAAKNVVEAAKNVEEAKNDGEGFTFGNAQKLINMTAKYFFITTYKKRGMRYKFKKCDCPLDGIMAEVVKEKIDALDDNEKHELEKNELKEIGLDLTKGWKSKLTKSWSRLELIDNNDCETYDFFQALVRYLCKQEDSELSPLEFDYLYWSAQK